MTSETSAQIEIIEPAATNQDEKPTVEEASASLSKAEMDLAKKHGLLKETSEDPAKKPDEKKTPEPVAEKKEEKTSSKVPDEDVAPEVYEKFTPNEKGLYWSQKKERQKRARAEVEKEQAILRARSLEREVEELRKKVSAAQAKPAKVEDDLGLEDLLSEEEKPKPDAKKPLTAEDLERIEKEKADKAKSEEAARVEKAAELKVRLKQFEVDAKETIEDFDHVADLAKEILQKGAELFDGDEERLELAQARAEKALNAMVHALEWTEGQKTPAELVYELGKLHPKYKTAKKSAEPAIPAEKMERMIENAGKRSSASLATGNGSRRAVSEDDLTLEDASKLTPSQYARLSRATRERLLRM